MKTTIIAFFSILCFQAIYCDTHSEKDIKIEHLRSSLRECYGEVFDKMVEVAECRQEKNKSVKDFVNKQ
jgi:hypothetical protein